MLSNVRQNLKNIYGELFPRTRVKLYGTSLAKYYLPTDVKQDIIINTMKKGEIFEPEIVEIAKKYIVKNSTVLDVGANLGQMSLIFSDFTGNEGQVFAFEADSFICSLLVKNIEVNNHSNIIALNKAVYDTNGKMMFYPVQDFKRFKSYGSYGLAPKLEANAKKCRKVETITIDSLDIKSFISFMKIDIQGSDLFALKGAIKTIQKYQMPIIFEYEEQFQEEFEISWQDYLDFIEAINYQIETVVNQINYLIVPR